MGRLLDDIRREWAETGAFAVYIGMCFGIGAFGVALVANSGWLIALWIGLIGACGGFLVFICFSVMVSVLDFFGDIDILNHRLW